MLAMVFDGKSPVLHDAQVADPVAGAGELLIDIHACGICRTDLHVVDLDLTEPKLPLIPGH
jgi:propanol-preferring alcohol dehydrogenase